ncbi:hypothetical protein N0V88_005605 [Collariella sp. IMI 366227]|nr:hypothetical protein N0V88_005605 [Collariella sp. IMI 366227]
MGFSRLKTPPGTDASNNPEAAPISKTSSHDGDATPAVDSAAQEPRAAKQAEEEKPAKATVILILAIPVITDEFNSLSDVGWYGSAYLLTCCAFQLLFGKIYTFFAIKPVLLASILLFEISSVICGAAPNSVAFIIGRAICGIGAAGIFAGTIVSIIYVVPLQHRPKIQGLFGALAGISSIVGPLLGGAFATDVTWRWCFYINLPIGGVAMVVIALFLKLPEGADESKKLPLTKKLVQLDLLGTALLMPGVVCLLLALEWGGSAYAWNNARIIALLTLASILLVAYGFVQTFSKTATLPPRLIKQRNVLSALWATICINSSMYLFIYYLPIYFQALLSLTPTTSGTHLLPVMLSMVFGTIFSGALNSVSDTTRPWASSASASYRI